MANNISLAAKCGIACLALVLAQSCSPSESGPGIPDNNQTYSSNQQGANNSTPLSPPATPVVPLPSAPTPPVSDPVTSATPLPADPVVVTPAESKPPAIEVPTIAASPIVCELKESLEKTIWEVTGSWGTYVSNLKNKDAAWLGIRPKAGDPVGCTRFAKTNKLILVSHFNLSAATKIKVEAIGDSGIVLRLWKDNSSKSEVFNSGYKSSVSQTIDLTGGSYSLVMDLVKDDENDDASYMGALASVLVDSNGTVLRQSDSSSNWCAYEVPKALDVPSFVDKNAAGKSCLGKP